MASRRSAHLNIGEPRDYGPTGAQIREILGTRAAKPKIAFNEWTVHPTSRVSVRAMKRSEPYCARRTTDDRVLSKAAGSKRLEEGLCKKKRAEKEKSPNGDPREDPTSDDEPLVALRAREHGALSARQHEANP